MSVGFEKTVEKPQHSFRINVLQKSTHKDKKLSREYLFYKKDYVI